MKNFEDYKRFGLDYFNDEIKIKENEDGSRECGFVKILGCGCVYAHNVLQEPCEKDIDIQKEKLKIEYEIKVGLNKLDLTSLRKLEEMFLGNDKIVNDKNIFRNKLKNIRNAKNLEDLNKIKGDIEC
jgi:hypothetical protein